MHWQNQVKLSVQQGLFGAKYKIQGKEVVIMLCLSSAPLNVNFHSRELLHPSSTSVRVDKNQEQTKTFLQRLQILHTCT